MMDLFKQTQIIYFVVLVLFGCQSNQVREHLPQNGVQESDITETNPVCIHIIDSLRTPYRTFVTSVDSIYSEINTIDSLNKINMQKGSELLRMGGRNSAAIKATKQITDLYVQRYMELLKAISNEKLSERNIFSLDMFTNGMGYVSIDELKEFVISLPAHLQSTKVTTRAKSKFDRFDGLTGLAVPDSFDDVLEGMDGKTQLFSEWHPQLKDNQVLAVNVSIDTKKAAWQQSEEQDALDWESFLLKEGERASMYHQLTLNQSIPVILLLNAENQIISISSDIRHVVRQLPFVCFEVSI